MRLMVVAFIVVLFTTVGSTAYESFSLTEGPPPAAAREKGAQKEDFETEGTMAMGLYKMNLERACRDAGYNGAAILSIQKGVWHVPQTDGYWIVYQCYSM